MGFFPSAPNSRVTKSENVSLTTPTFPPPSSPSPRASPPAAALSLPSYSTPQQLRTGSHLQRDRRVPHAHNRSSGWKDLREPHGAPTWTCTEPGAAALRDPSTLPWAPHSSAAPDAEEAGTPRRRPRGVNTAVPARSRWVSAWAPLPVHV